MINVYINNVYAWNDYDGKKEEDDEEKKIIIYTVRDSKLWFDISISI